MKSEFNEPSALTTVLNKLDAAAKTKPLLKNNLLLNKIKLNRDINTVDENKQTIMHHLINSIDPKVINPTELEEVLDIVRRIALLMGDRALNKSDRCQNKSAIQLAADSEILEIFWAIMQKLCLPMLLHFSLLVRLMTQNLSLLIHLMRFLLTLLNSIGRLSYL